MSLTQALLTAVIAETSGIIFLFGIVLSKNKEQDRRLEICEQDRARLNGEAASLQKQIANIWEQLFKAGVKMQPVEPKAP